MKKPIKEPFCLLESGIMKREKVASPAETERKRQFGLFLAKVLSCILIALLFLVAAFEPGFAIFLSCLGVVVACSIAAVLVDRQCRRGRYEP